MNKLVFDIGSHGVIHVLVDTDEQYEKRIVDWGVSFFDMNKVDVDVEFEFGTAEFEFLKWVKNLDKFKNVKTDEKLKGIILQSMSVVDEIMKKYSVSETTLDMSDEVAYHHCGIKRSNPFLRYDLRYNRSWTRHHWQFHEIFGVDSVEGKVFHRFFHWKKQYGKCLYTGKNLDLRKLLLNETPDSLTVDHIVPFSRSKDDSFDNKILCEKQSNLKKKNMTPYEWIYCGNKRWWKAFEERVRQTDYLSSGMRNRLLSKGIDERYAPLLNKTKKMKVEIQDLTKEMIDQIVCVQEYQDISISLKKWFENGKPMDEGSLPKSSAGETIRRVKIRFLMENGRITTKPWFVRKIEDDSGEVVSRISP